VERSWVGRIRFPTYPHFARTPVCRVARRVAGRTDVGSHHWEDTPWELWALPAGGGAVQQPPIEEHVLAHLPVAGVSISTGVTLRSGGDGRHSGARNHTAGRAGGRLWEDRTRGWLMWVAGPGTPSTLQSEGTPVATPCGLVLVRVHSIVSGDMIG
jgi:hypothetical protein